MDSWTDIPPSRVGETEIPSYRLFQGTIEKPETDNREYRILELQNGVRTVLIHDPDADKAAACLALSIGYMHDPVYIPIPSSDNVPLRPSRDGVSYTGRRPGHGPFL